MFALVEPIPSMDTLTNDGPWPVMLGLPAEADVRAKEEPRGTKICSVCIPCTGNQDSGHIPEPYPFAKLAIISCSEVAKA